MTSPALTHPGRAGTPFSGGSCEKGNFEYARIKALKDGRSFVFGKLFWAGKI
jgi:hypothetical protein